MRIRTAVLLVLSLAVVAGGSYLTYRWYQQSYLPAPAPSEDEPSLTEDERSDLEVTLPRDLQEDLQKNEQRQRRLFREAVQAHSQGDYSRAIEKYREAISFSGKDTIAARSYRYLGDIYVRDDSYDQAIRLYEFALRIEPDNPQFHYRLGMTFKEKGNLDDAAESLDRAIELGDRAEFYLARGNLHYDRSEFSQAEENYESGIQTGSELSRLYPNLALVREQQGKTEEAIEAYRLALEESLENPLHYQVHLNKGKLHMKLDQYHEAVTEFSNARELNGTVEAWYNLGLARAESDDLNGAVKAFESALSQAPEDVDIMKDLGTVYQELEEYPRAIEYYERALDQRPDSSDLLLALGRLYEKVGENRQALGYYQQLVKKGERGPRLQLTFRRVGELYLSMDEPKKAQPAFRNVLSMDTSLAEVHYNLGIAYRRSDQMEDAIEEFRKARDLERESVQYQLAYADSLYRAGLLKRAQKAYRRVKELDPSYHEADYMIAYLHYRWGNLDRARRGFQSLVEQLDDGTLLVKTYQNLGNIYLRNGDLPRAETSYRQALAIEKTAETYFNLGLVYSRRENWEVASTVFRNALERDAKNPHYQAALGLALYQKALYREAKKYIQDALSADPSNLRNHYNLERLQETLEEINEQVSQT